MLTLAFSMILYGLLVKMSSARQHRRVQRRPRRFAASPSRARTAPVYATHGRCRRVRRAAAGPVSRVATSAGFAPAIRDNELRVEYMGASVRNVVHLN